MTVKERYEAAKEIYRAVGVDTDAALAALKNIPVSMHCWQGDDVIGFDGAGALSGGIQATGNYPGRARTPEELMADMDEALSLIPGTHRINLHASYAVFEEGEWADRDKLEPKHFAKWVEFAKERGLGIDFNPTLFSHAKAENATLSSEVLEIRKFWIDHVKACIRISEYFAKELGTPCTMNIWIPDGFKDIPADRTAPRARLKDSLDQILSIDYDKSSVFVAVESKVFGIGMESCTVGSHEFYMNYASKNDILCLLDSGHYHPTEVVSDKISSMLLFFDKVALHVTRPVRWDSDHVVLFDDRGGNHPRRRRPRLTGPRFLRCQHQPHQCLGCRHAQYAESAVKRIASSERQDGGTSEQQAVYGINDAFRGNEDLSVRRCMGLLLRAERRPG